MKTIEEAANEIYPLNKPTMYTQFVAGLEQSAFKAGVEFAQRWIPVEEELPKKLKIVLVLCNNNGKIHTTTAQFVPPKSVLASDFLDDDSSEECAEYDEEIDDYYVISGWWEYQTEVDINWKISSEVTHWRPIEIK